MIPAGSKGLMIKEGCKGFMITLHVKGEMFIIPNGTCRHPEKMNRPIFESIVQTLRSTHQICFTGVVRTWLSIQK